MLFGWKTKLDPPPVSVAFTVVAPPCAGWAFARTVLGTRNTMLVTNIPRITLRTINPPRCRAPAPCRSWGAPRDAHGGDSTQEWPTVALAGGGGVSS